MQEYGDLVHRASEWFAQQLPELESLSSFRIYVKGVKLDQPGNLTDFHTFACLFPERGIWVAMRTKPLDVDPEHVVHGPEVRKIIAEFEPPEHWVLKQREVAGERLSGSTAVERWNTACWLAMRYRLPVALFAFGHTIETHELSVYMCSAEVAPLRRVAQEFKKAAPEVALN